MPSFTRSGSGGSEGNESASRVSYDDSSPPLGRRFSFGRWAHGGASRPPRDSFRSSTSSSASSIRGDSKRMQDAFKSSFKRGVTKMLAYEDIGTFEKESLKNASSKGSYSIEVDVDDNFNGEERVKMTSSNNALSKLLKFTENVVSSDVQQSGVDKSTFMDVLLAIEWRSNTCLSLPVTLAFFCLFVVFFQRHFANSRVYLQESSLRIHLTDGAAGMQGPDDIYDYLSGTFFPFLWSCPNIVGNLSETLPTRNLVLAGASVTTSWGAQEECSGSRLFGVACPDDTAWVPDSGSGWVQLSRRLEGRAAANSTHIEAGRGYDGSLPAGGNDRIAPWPIDGAAHASTSGGAPDGRRAKVVEAYWGDLLPAEHGKPTTYEYTFPVTMSLEEVTTFVQESLRDAQVIRPDVRYFRAETIVTNEYMGDGLVTHLQVTFLFNRVGTIFTEAKFQTISLTFAASPLAFLGWTICLVFETFNLIRQMIAAKLAGKFRDYWSVHNIIDTWLFVCAWIIMAVFVYDRILMSSFKAEWESIEERRHAAGEGELEEINRQWYNTLSSMADQCGFVGSYLLIFVADYHIFFIVRILLASRGQARLALVVTTMSRGLVDMLHLGVVIAIIFVPYTISGHILFGRQLEEFSTLGGSLGYLLQMLFQRNYEWSMLTEASLIAAGLWVITFMVLVVLVLTNLVLAMVFDIYAHVRSGMDEKDTVLRSFRLITNKFRNLSVWVRTMDLLRAIQGLDAGSNIDKDALLSLFPHMCQVQVDSIFDDAKRLLTTTVSRQNQKYLLPEAIACMLIHIDALRESLEDLYTEREESARSGSPCVRGGRAPEPDAQHPPWIGFGLLPHLKEEVGNLDALCQELADIEGMLQGCGSEGLRTIAAERLTHDNRGSGIGYSSGAFSTGSFSGSSTAGEGVALARPTSPAPAASEASAAPSPRIFAVATAAPGLASVGGSDTAPRNDRAASFHAGAAPAGHCADAPPTTGSPAAHIVLDVQTREADDYIEEAMGGQEFPTEPPAGTHEDITVNLELSV